MGSESISKLKFRVLKGNNHQIYQCSYLSFFFNKNDSSLLGDRISDIMCVFVEDVSQPKRR